jgi:hypothetical protein
MQEALVGRGAGFVRDGVCLCDEHGCACTTSVRATGVGMHERGGVTFTMGVRAGGLRAR